MAAEVLVGVAAGELLAAKLPAAELAAAELPAEELTAETLAKDLDWGGKRRQGKSELS